MVHWQKKEITLAAGKLDTLTWIHRQELYSMLMQTKVRSLGVFHYNTHMQLPWFFQKRAEETEQTSQDL